MAQMRCTLCREYGIYWKDLHTVSPYSYCPHCKGTNCHELEEDTEDDEDEELSGGQMTESEKIEVELLSCCEGDEYWGWFVRGHVDKQEFFEAIKQLQSSHGWHNHRLKSERISEIEHVYFRKIPQPHSGCYECLYVNAEAGKQGAFPVTFLYYW